MKAFNFNPDQSFRDVRRMMAELNSPAHKTYIAKLVWMEGTPAKEPLTFLWDPYAERFGHQIDKEAIDTEIVDSLINEIPVMVELVPPKATRVTH